MTVADMQANTQSAATESLVKYIEVDTPIGVLVVTSEGDAVTGVYMETQRHAPIQRDHWQHDRRAEVRVLNIAKQQLVEYFMGERTTFDVPLSPRGTDVQKNVWRALSEIPYGETR